MEMTSFCPELAGLQVRDMVDCSTSMGASVGLLPQPEQPSKRQKRRSVRRAARQLIIGPIKSFYHLFSRPDKEYGDIPFLYIGRELHYDRDE
jgi:hypothetical protein